MVEKRDIKQKSFFDNYLYDTKEFIIIVYHIYQLVGNIVIKIRLNINPFRSKIAA